MTETLDLKLYWNSLAVLKQLIYVAYMLIFKRGHDIFVNKE